MDGMGETVVVALLPQDRQGMVLVLLALDLGLDRQAIQFHSVVIAKRPSV
jgi:hypothetical protein